MLAGGDNSLVSLVAVTPRLYILRIDDEHAHTLSPSTLAHISIYLFSKIFNFFIIFLILFIYIFIYYLYSIKRCIQTTFELVGRNNGVGVTRLVCSGDDLRKLALAKVHLGVLGHEHLQHVLLLLLLGGGQAELLLALVVHHLLHHRASLAIQVGQLRRLGIHLLGVDLGIGRQQATPPFHAILLGERDHYVDGVLDHPQTLVHLDLVVQLSIDDEGMT